MRRVYALLLPAAALAACAPGGSESERGGSLVPFEVARAQPGDDVAGLQGVVTEVSPEELRAMMDREDLRLIDVRTAEEVAEGMIEGAEHIPLDRFDPAALDYSDGRRIVLYCRSGRRSGIAGSALALHLAKPAMHLAGGIKAWRQAGYPVSAR
ncbi:rhodanese-like domain-containing protein [Qipengyuania nanhaisediminis]|uniref:rhodanese-like domain-containing protein n=1 Tax=Qipengyuania nanhaisediminis TaxID=604088 RepID=UPI0038B27773